MKILNAKRIFSNLHPITPNVPESHCTHQNMNFVPESTQSGRWKWVFHSDRGKTCIKVLSLFWALLCKFHPDLSEKPTSTCPIRLIQVPKFSLQQAKCVFRTFGVIGWKLEKIFLGLENSHKVVDVTVLSTFVQVLIRSGWIILLHLYDPFDFSAKMHLLPSV